MNLFIDIQPSKTLPRVFITLWVLLIVSFILFVTSQFSLLTSLILLLLGAFIVIPFALWQRKAFNNLNRGVKQLQFVDGCWYLVMQHGSKTDKQAIELANDNVLWPWWIKLAYRLGQDEEDLSFMTRLPLHKKQQQRQLLICRDAVSESDFRHLSRVLRFYRNDSEEPVELD